MPGFGVGVVVEVVVVAVVEMAVLEFYPIGGVVVGEGLFGFEVAVEVEGEEVEIGADWVGEDGEIVVFDEEVGVGWKIVGEGDCGPPFYRLPPDSGGPFYDVVDVLLLALGGDFYFLEGTVDFVEFVAFWVEDGEEEAFFGGADEEFVFVGHRFHMGSGP